MAYSRLYPQNITPKGTNIQTGFANDDNEIKRIYSLLSDIGGLQLFGSKRQSVLYGPTDSSGNPSFLTASDLSITIDGSTKPILLAFAAGFSLAQGTIDFLDGISGAISSAWTLPANNTCYLYIDKDASTGLLSYGYTVSPDQYMAAAPSSPVLDQHYFNTAEMKMYRYNGSSWEEKRRIFIASVVTGASSATIAHYPMRSPMDKAAAAWALMWTWNFIFANPSAGYVSPPLPLARNGTCNSIKFYPDATPSAATSVYVFQGNSLYLGAALTNAATSATLSVTVANAVPFYALIDKEVVQVTAVSGTTATIVRAQLGTTATTHDSGTLISLPIGNVSLSTKGITTLALSNLSGSMHDQFFYVASGGGLSAVNTTIAQEWVNRS